MGAKRKSYTPKYRQEAARLVIETGRPVAAVAREIGVGEALLGRWVAIERSRMYDPPGAVDADERAELVRLRREVAELRMDREFLKKAAVSSTGHGNGDGVVEFSGWGDVAEHFAWPVVQLQGNVVQLCLGTR